MKKLFTGVILSFLLITAAVAESDIQLAVEPINVSTMYLYTVNAGLENHNYFGDTNTFGFGEKITYSVYSDKYIVGSILAGPAFAHKFKLFKLQVISGFKYTFGYFSLSKDWSNTNLSVNNHTYIHGFEWGNDIQFKFIDDEMISVIAGISASFGKEFSYDTQSVTDKTGYGKYNTIYGKYKNDNGIFTAAPYIAVSYNW